MNENTIEAPHHVSQLSTTEMHRCLARLTAESSDTEVLHRLDGKTVARCRPTPRRTVIVKQYERTDLRACIRRRLGIGAGDYELRNLRQFCRAGIRVPKPLGWLRFRRDGRTRQALFMEDLGPCTDSLALIKRQMRDGDAIGLAASETELVTMVRRMAEHGYVDTDFGLLNVLVPQGSTELVRVDLELARYVMWPLRFPRLLGLTLGRLIGTYTFAVQPEVARVYRFAERVADAVRPSRRALGAATAYLRGELLAEQRERQGIDTRIVLPWDRGSS